MTFDDIVADTDDGLLFETNRSWSIDDRRLNFQFGTEICREIKGGKLGRLYRNATYTGITYELWRSMDAVGDACSWPMWGTPNCGKGEPSQAGHVGHGVSAARGSATCGWGWSHERAHGIGGDPAGGAPPRRARSSGGAGRGCDGGRGARRRRRVRADPVREQRDPPERRQQPRSSSTSASSQGRRVGVASIRADGRGGDARARRAGAAIAANVEELEDWAGLPEADAAEPLPAAWSDGTAHATPGAPRRGRPRGHRRCRRGRRHRVRLLLDGRRGGRGRQLARASARPSAAPAAQLLTVTMGPDNGTGYAEQCRVDATPIDAAAIGREAAERARASANPVDLAARRLPGRPQLDYAVVDLLDMLGYLGFSALAVAGGPLVLGARQAGRLARSSRSSTTAAIPPACPSGFDAEGVPEAAAGPARRGRLPRPRLRRRRPRRAAAAAPPAMACLRPNTVRPVPHEHGRWPRATRPMDELVGGLDRGLLVTRFHYTNPVHGKKVIITGMTRDGTFLVEGGQIVGPVRNLRFTMSYLDALANVEAVSRERRCLRGFMGGSVVPSRAPLVVLVHRRDGGRVGGGGGDGHQRPDRPRTSPSTRSPTAPSPSTRARGSWPWAATTSSGSWTASRRTAGRCACWAAPAAPTTATRPPSSRATPRWAPPRTCWGWPTRAGSTVIRDEG